MLNIQLLWQEIFDEECKSLRAHETLLLILEEKFRHESVQLKTFFLEHI